MKPNMTWRHLVTTHIFPRRTSISAVPSIESTRIANIAGGSLEFFTSADRFIKYQEERFFLSIHFALRRKIVSHHTCSLTVSGFNVDLYSMPWYTSIAPIASVRCSVQSNLYALGALRIAMAAADHY
jgi:hypothetical protein